LVFARMSTWHFKKGKRETAFLEIDRVLETATRHVEGFRGYMSLLSREDPNTATVLTLWQDEETLKKTEGGTLQDAVKKVQNSLESPPCIENFRVFSTELFQRAE
jgi:heme-degrading monooxygenase HmoA